MNLYDSRCHRDDHYLLFTYMNFCSNTIQYYDYLRHSPKRQQRLCTCQASSKIGTFLEPDRLKIATFLWFGVSVRAPYKWRRPTRSTRTLLLKECKPLQPCCTGPLHRQRAIITHAFRYWEEGYAMGLVSWAIDWVLIWDAIFANTLAPSYLHETWASAQLSKYKGLGNKHDFDPFGIETLGPLSRRAINCF